MYRKLENDIRHNHLNDEVILVGRSTNMDTFMQSIDLLLSTSLWEGFGYVIAEAAMHKKPVIAWNVSSNPELIIHNKTGFLIPLGDVVGMCSRIVELHENPMMKNQMGQHGSDHCMTNFTILQSIDSLEKFLTLV